MFGTFSRAHAAKMALKHSHSLQLAEACPLNLQVSLQRGPSAGQELEDSGNAEEVEMLVKGFMAEHSAQSSF